MLKTVLDRWMEISMMLFAIAFSVSYFLKAYKECERPTPVDPNGARVECVKQAWTQHDRIECLKAAL